MFELSVCAIVRNEINYLEEWLEYHLLQGVEHFYIYDNESTDGTTEILRRYEKLGLVTLTAILGEGAQLSAYSSFLKVYGAYSKWVAFIDCDEFLYARFWPTITSYLQMIEQHEEEGDWPKPIAALAIHWVLMGSNGLKEYDGRLCIERFTQREQGANSHVKSIVRPAFTHGISKDPHSFLVREGAHVVDESGILLDHRAGYAIHPGGTANTLRCYHFHTKSRLEYTARKSDRPRGDMSVKFTPERIEEMFQAHDLNQRKDLNLFRYAEDVRENIKARREGVKPTPRFLPRINIVL